MIKVVGDDLIYNNTIVGKINRSSLPNSQMEELICKLEEKRKVHEWDLEEGPE